MRMRIGISSFRGGGVSLEGAAAGSLGFGERFLSSLGTQKVAANLPAPTEPFRFTEIWREIKQISQSVTNQNFLWLFVYSLLVGAAAGRNPT